MIFVFFQRLFTENWAGRKRSDLKFAPKIITCFLNKYHFLTECSSLGMPIPLNRSITSNLDQFTFWYRVGTKESYSYGLSPRYKSSLCQLPWVVLPINENYSKYIKRTLSHRACGTRTCACDGTYAGRNRVRIKERHALGQSSNSAVSRVDALFICMWIMKRMLRLEFV